MSDSKAMMQSKILPAVALRGMTALPGAIIRFDLNRDKSVAALEQAMMRGGQIFLVAQRDMSEKIPSFEEMYHVGTVAVIKQITKLPNRVIRVLVEGVSRGIFKGKRKQKEKQCAVS